MRVAYFSLAEVLMPGEDGNEWSPIVVSYQALQARQPSWYVEIGLPQGPGWIRGTELQTASEGPFNERPVGEDHVFMGQPVYHYRRAARGATKRLAVCLAFFTGNDVVAQMPPRFYPVPYDAVTHLSHCRATCCRYYLLPQGHYCASCPLLSQAERVQRNQIWMQRLLGSSEPS